MPLYEFYCKKCGHEIAEIQSYKDPIPDCEKCDAGTMTRAIGNPAPITKGAGLFSIDSPSVKKFGDME